jgi:uncharacterized protein YlxP (DUF503 family)
MVVGSGVIVLWIPESGSLKEKRAVLKGLIKKTQNDFNVSIAEVGDNDHWRRAKIGFAVVGNDRRFVNAKMDHILNFIDRIKAAEVVSSNFEITVLSDMAGMGGTETDKYDDFQEG